jgi:hypothetical protein
VKFPGFQIAGRVSGGRPEALQELVGGARPGGEARRVRQRWGEDGVTSARRGGAGGRWLHQLLLQGGGRAGRGRGEAGRGGARGEVAGPFLLQRWRPAAGPGRAEGVIWK